MPLYLSVFPNAPCPLLFFYNLLFLHESVSDALGIRHFFSIGLFILCEDHIINGFSTISVTFCMAFAIRRYNNKIASLTISPSSSDLLPFCSTDSFTLSVISVFLSSSISASDTPLTIARSTALFHSMRISLSAFISSAFGLFLPTFFVARYRLFLSNMLSSANDLKP